MGSLNEHEAKRKRFAVTPLRIVVVILIVALAVTAYYSYAQTQLLNLLLAPSPNSPSPPVSELQAIEIALNYGGWNAFSLNGKKLYVSLDLYYSGYFPADSSLPGVNGSSGPAGYALGIAKQITQPQANYSSYKVGDVTYQYVWEIVITNPGPPQLPPPGVYYVNVATGAVWSHSGF